MSIPLTMETLCGGGVIESLHHEIQHVLDNVADVTVQASSKLIAAYLAAAVGDGAVIIA